MKWFEKKAINHKQGIPWIKKIAIPEQITFSTQPLQSDEIHKSNSEKDTNQDIKQMIYDTQNTILQVPDHWPDWVDNDTDKLTDDSTHNVASDIKNINLLHKSYFFHKTDKKQARIYDIMEEDDTDVLDDNLVYGLDTPDTQKTPITEPVTNNLVDRVPIISQKKQYVEEEDTNLHQFHDMDSKHTPFSNVNPTNKQDTQHPIIEKSMEDDTSTNFESALEDVPVECYDNVEPVEMHISKDSQASITPNIWSSKAYLISKHILQVNRGIVEWLSPEEIQQITHKLERTLKEFDVDAKVVGNQKGPIITRFELQMSPGTKVNKILNLNDELAMALKAMSIRIEAPIPGRSTIGIEIPNSKRNTVFLGDIVNKIDYSKCDNKIPLPIGKDIAGNIILADLTKLPHLLVAGATGSGKSVLINSFIVHLTLMKSPMEIRFLLIDPKLVELSQYNSIPHLLHPVITDSHKSISALNWAVEEMERRYEDLSDARVRDIIAYNEKMKQTNNMKYAMPYIIILIDELGDLMMVAGKEIETSIIRLSQKARAVGIHLILATQRPSVDVITALIKANCPARIALQVAQKTDSRTILDANGAEQLLGEGDALFKHPTKNNLIRIQTPFVQDHEVAMMVEQASTYIKPQYIKLENADNTSYKLNPEDEELLDKAWNIILESDRASASYLQRRLKIGYNKAARLIEALEAKQYIGPQIGSKPRDILKKN